MRIDSDLPALPVSESRGQREDLNLFEEVHWMQDTEVKYLIQPMRGRWHVSLLFIALKGPLKMIVRKIDHYPSLKKAETFAGILQRGSRKDARGTLKRKQHAYHICSN